MENDQRKNIRPSIKKISSDSCSAEENFQNQTLRPILKLQNDLLIVRFHEQISNLKIDWKKQPQEEKKVIIDQLFKHNLQFKTSLIYLIAGQFTPTEFQFFFQYSKSLSKRICHMAKERIVSQVC